jgi:hypothetical protein
MGPLGGFWPKLGRKRVTGWKQRSCVPPGRVKTTTIMTTPINSWSDGLTDNFHLNLNFSECENFMGHPVCKIIVLYFAINISTYIIILYRLLAPIFLCDVCGFFAVPVTCIISCILFFTRKLRSICDMIGYVYFLHATIDVQVNGTAGNSSPIGNFSNTAKDTFTGASRDTNSLLNCRRL